jgi:acyl-CoA synthetase (AMP-forming)/AMP-acid ligase II
MDTDGYYYFISRKDEMINSRGRKIAPRVIEDALYQLPGVLAAAVIGVPDELLGEAIKAFIASSNDMLTQAQVRKHCLALLESFMIPQFIEITTSLPVNENGKVDKVKLKAYQK